VRWLGRGAWRGGGRASGSDPKRRRRERRSTSWRAEDGRGVWWAHDDGALASGGGHGEPASPAGRCGYYEELRHLIAPVGHRRRRSRAWRYTETTSPCLLASGAADVMGLPTCEKDRRHLGAGGSDATDADKWRGERGPSARRRSSRRRSRSTTLRRGREKRASSTSDGRASRPKASRYRRSPAVAYSGLTSRRSPGAGHRLRRGTAIVRRNGGCGRVV